MTDRWKDILRRVLSRVREDPYTGCWVWTGPTSGEGRGGGYARMSLDGRTVAVHKLMFVHFNGMVPGNKQIDHVCRRRLCVRPCHLELVTHKENCRRRDVGDARLPENMSLSDLRRYAE